MAKEKMQIRLKSYFEPEEGQYGMSQGSYVVTDKGEFKCYNSGPQWFGMNEKGQVIEVVGEWKQSQQNQQWYLACTYGKPVSGPPTPQSEQGFKPQQATPQNRPQAPSQPRQPSKDRLIVAQVVYKAMASMYPAQVTEGVNYLGDFDIWLMGNQLVFKRHVDLIMQIGAGETPKQSGQTDEFDEAMNRPDF